MHKSISCVVFAILLLFSFNVGQDDHPALYDAAHEQVLLVSAEEAEDAAMDYTVNDSIN